ncbi:MAG: hypothetical protein HZA50_19355 [Planctomycetes bacterium]|nr:hypothetical protein [Planctomycetota bacterium]
MKIFLAGIMQGSLVEADIHSQDWREPIKSILARHLPAAEVYCHFSRHPGSIDYGLTEIAGTLEEGNRMAAASDVLVAYLPSASMGTAIEMYEAWRGGAIVLAITPMAANWVVRAYSHKIFPDLPAFEKFLASGELEQLIEQKPKRPR